MKRTITGILVILTVITVLCLVACGVSNTTTTTTQTTVATTTTQATVTAIEGDEVILTDTNGEMWMWTGTEDYAIDEEVVITFDTMDTEYLYDDEILTITKR